MRAILTYHSIDDSGSPISVSPRTFASHVRFLASGAVEVTTLEKLARGQCGATALALTFDDGFANFRDRAWPLLREARLPTTQFIVTGRVGTTNDWGEPAPGIPKLPLLDWEDLKTLAGEGLDLGAHSRTHPHLDRLDPAAVEAECAGAKADIEEVTGVRPRTFAYPFGDVDAKVAALVARHFEIAVTTELSAIGDHADPRLLPRLDAYYFQAQGRLESFGTPGFRRYLWLRSWARRVRARLRGGLCGVRSRR